MRIGHDDNFLCIERVSQTPCPIWRLEARALGAGWMFAAMYDRVLVTASDEALKDAAAFTELKVQRVEVELSEGGWLRFRRDVRGYILLQYRVGRLKEGAAIEGEIVLEVEPAKAFCQDLHSIL